MTQQMLRDAPMELDDEHLVLACRQGDATAWEELVRRYQRLIYSIPRRAGLDADLADEVFQQVFTTLIEHLDRLEQPGRIGAWLATTTRHESWRVSRRARATQPIGQRVENDDGVADIPDKALLPDEVLIQMELQHAVRTALTTLDERCCTLLTLLFYATPTPPYDEIAATLGTSLGSIGPTRARCLQKLRKILDEHMLNDEGL